MRYTVVVFDLGETLMEYKGMQLSWDGYYQKAFEYVNEKLALALTSEQIVGSVELLKSYNPRVKAREQEIAAETIFSDVVSRWNVKKLPLGKVIASFFESLKLEPVIYEDSIPTLKRIHEAGIKTAAMTDVASAMPDELHKRYVSPLLPYFDLYVSSVSCGWRKPNPKGLSDIARHFSAAPTEMVMIGDTQRDVQAAKNFGCASVLICRKSDGTARLPDFGQDFTVRSAREVGELVASRADGWSL